MSGPANIRDIQALGRLKTALGRFSEGVIQALGNIEKQFEEIRDQFAERELDSEKKCDQAREDLNRARESLSDCESQGYTDDEGDYQEPDCSFESEQVSDARLVLVESEEKLEIVKQWRHRTEEEIAAFQQDIHQLANLASTRTGSAQAFLTTKIAALDAYMAYLPPADYRHPKSVIAGAAFRDEPTGIGILTLLGDDDEKSQLRAGFELLSQMTIGRKLISTLNSLGTEIQFGPCSDKNGNECFGSYDRSKDPPVITLSKSLKGRVSSVIAGHLAHEATHAKWHRKGSVEQEYDAYKTQAVVWTFLKNSDMSSRDEGEWSSQHERVCAMILKGVDIAKEEIQTMYPYLPQNDITTENDTF